MTTLDTVLVSAVTSFVTTIAVLLWPGRRPRPLDPGQLQRAMAGMTAAATAGAPRRRVPTGAELTERYGDGPEFCANYRTDTGAETCPSHPCAHCDPLRGIHPVE